MLPHFIHVLSLFLLTCRVNTHCPSGWYPSLINVMKCYFVAPDQMTWQDAENYCRSIIIGSNSHLTSILSAFDTNELNGIVANNPAIGLQDQVWLGATGINGDETFQWSDGSPFVYTNWLAGQPNRLYPCVSSLARSSGRWRTEPCATKNYFVCKYIIQPTSTPTDCYDWNFLNGNTTNGIYRIYPPGIDAFDVWCEMTTGGGGWTVFQKRMDGALSFENKTWNEYKTGFNNGLDKSLWLGNDKIHVLSTKDSNVELRIDLWGDRMSGSKYPNIYLYGKYASFHIDNESNNYTFYLNYSSTGNASYLDPPRTGIYYSDGREFSTVDRDSSPESFQCSSPSFYDGGWWTGSCTYGSLNGIYIWEGEGAGGEENNNIGLAWFWDYNSTTIRPSQTRMMLRKSIS